MATDRSLTCIFCGDYLFDSPRQAACGDRLCGQCYSGYQTRAKGELRCPACGSSIDLNTCFRDKAAEVELASAVLQCTNKGCPWQGEGRNFKSHVRQCKFAVVQCPNPECGERMYRSDLNMHLENCPLTPVPCQWCRKDVPLQHQKLHLSNECEEVLVTCPNGCKEKCTRKDLMDHRANVCKLEVRSCDFVENGCQFRGNVKELEAHNDEQVSYHLKLMKKSMKQPQSPNEVTLVSRHAEEKIGRYDQKVSALRSEIDQLKAEMSSKIQPVVEAVVKMESAVKQLQDGFGEMALLVQTLQATSYNGVFIWKIPEVQRRRQEAKMGRTISLYSAPFYTSRHGYKLCLRLYMDGDGSGKGSHLSFFLTIMRGEFDALLPWPFKQTVSLILLDQDKQRDVIQSFRPEPSSSSFQRPRLEMNVASGCPTFASLSVLNSTSYVKDNTMFLKCVIDRSGLENT